MVADMLSRPSLSALQLSQGINLIVMAAEQRRVGCPGDESVSSLQQADVPLTTGTGTILCNVSIPCCVEFCFTLFMDSHTLGSGPHKSSSRKGLSGLAWTRMSKLGHGCV
ncbi:unnamed protein product [Schistocephalus solidus]|uniref:Uncharacterized protein n=1 Tax=Schistocephalus solidus TaxID=70667 RepID=A0A183T2J3_SCHSO|nr:unnamed protein product [Schistocephalus solidus]